MTTRNLLPANIARAGVEGLLASMAYCVDKISAQGVEAERIILIGGERARKRSGVIAPAIFGNPCSCRRPPSMSRLGRPGRRHGRCRNRIRRRRGRSE